MIESAGKAIQVLANANPDASTLQEHQSIFSDAVSEYFTLLSSVDVQLRRQVYALQEAGLISDASSQDSQGAPTLITGRDRAPTVPIRDIVGIATPLDISWLNSRKDAVGRAIREQIWKETKLAIEEGRGIEDGANR